MFDNQSRELVVGRRSGLMVLSTEARFSKALETFRARKAIFSSSVTVSKNRDVYTPETPCM